MNLSARDAILPVVPMFHVNAWGLPYAAALVGAKLVFPGPALDGKSLHELFEAERVTFTAGVPTVWLSVLQHLQTSGATLSTVRRMIVGGAACPPALMQAFARDYGVARYGARRGSTVHPSSRCQLMALLASPVGMEVQRLLDVLEQHLEGRQYMVGEAYTLADMACFPWVQTLRGKGYDREGQVGLCSNSSTSGTSAQLRTPPN